MMHQANLMFAVFLVSTFFYGCTGVRQEVMKSPVQDPPKGHTATQKVYHHKPVRPKISQAMAKQISRLSLVRSKQYRHIAGMAEVKLANVLKQCVSVRACPRIIDYEAYRKIRYDMLAYHLGTNRLTHRQGYLIHLAYNLVALATETHYPLCMVKHVASGVQVAFKGYAPRRIPKRYQAYVDRYINKIHCVTLPAPIR